MSAPPAKKSKQNDGKAQPKQQQPKQQQQGKKPQQQGGKPQQPKQQQQGKKDQPKQPQQQQQQGGQDGQKLSKNQKKKFKKQQQGGAAPASAPAPAPAAAPAKPTKQDKKQPEKKKQESKKRPLEQKEEPEEDEEPQQAGDEDDDADPFDISDECLEKMADIQGKLDRVERKGAKEIAVIEKKMAAERQPFYLERAEQLRTIPHVWKEIFTSVDVFANELQENDVDILQYLENVMITDHAFEGFETDFEFADNPIFSNKKLSINLKFPPPSDESDDEEEDDQEQAEATVSPIQWKDASYPKTHANSWFVRFFTENFIDDYDNQQTLQFLRDHVWPSPLEALSGALNNDDDDDDLDPIMMENSDDDGDAPDLIPADGDDDDEE